MPDTIEKRASNLEYILAHLPEDLDTRFTGVELKIAQMREVQQLHTQRFTAIEARLDAMHGRLEAMDGKLDKDPRVSNEGWEVDPLDPLGIRG